MEDNVTREPNRKETVLDRHGFKFLIAGTIVIALTMVIISMVIYNVSGSVQLDLSRPGYKALTEQAEPTVKIEEYNSSGPVNAETIDEFINLYESQSEKAKAIDAFNGDPLNPEVLEFGDAS